MTDKWYSPRWCATCKAYRKSDHEHPLSLFDPVRAVDDNTAYVGKNHPDTAQEMQRKAFPRSGSYRREIYDLLKAREGLTDYELEDITGHPHQSASGARSMLKKDGWVRDSGKRRLNRFGNKVIVWEVVP